MRFLRWRALMVTPAVVLGVLIPATEPASALPIATVCAVAGTVAVSPGVGGIPPGGDNNGTYTFTQVAMVCAGGMNGVASPSSTGRFGWATCGGPATDPPLIGSFCGTYNTGPGTMVDVTDPPPPTVEANVSCGGTIGGKEVGALNPSNVLIGDWSATFATIIAGGLTCPSGNTMTGGVGAVLLHAEPLAADTVAGVGTGNCPPPPGLGAPVPDPAVWFCSIAVEGVAVLEGTDA